MQIDQEKLNRKDAPALAFHRTSGRMPTVVFLTGFRSDMTGAKALHLEQHCARQGRPSSLRLSRPRRLGRPLRGGCVGDWRDDALAMLDEVVPGPVVLVGSSMGGWIMLLVALARPERVRGLVGLASAPDFTRDLIARA